MDEHFKRTINCGYFSSGISKGKLPALHFRKPRPVFDSNRSRPAELQKQGYLFREAIIPLFCEQKSTSVV